MSEPRCDNDFFCDECPDCLSGSDPANRLRHDATPPVPAGPNPVEKPTGSAVPAGDEREAARERVTAVLHDFQCDEEPEGHDWREHLPADAGVDESEGLRFVDALIAAAGVRLTEGRNK